MCLHLILYIIAPRIKNNQATYLFFFSFLWLQYSSFFHISSWLCLSSAVAVSHQIPHIPKSSYAMVMFACSETGRSIKPKDPRPSNSEEGFMQL